MSASPNFISKALAAINQADFEAIEGLRDEIRPADVPELVKTWQPSLPWLIKDGYAALLMDQLGEVVQPVMADALNSPTAETRAYALCSLTGDNSLFDQLLTSGGVDARKVDAAVARYRAQRR